MSQIKIAFFLLATTALLSCKSKKTTEPNTTVNQEIWVTKPLSSWPQILLTNSFTFQNRPAGNGASAFLLDYHNNIYMCTAKHLLGTDMGIDPPVPMDSVNALLGYWKVFPRKNVVSKDTLWAKSLINTTEKDTVDLLLFQLKSTLTDIMALKPRLDSVKIGQGLNIIACEYKNTDCIQNLYPATVYRYYQGKIMIKCGSFEPSGFSGAPVIDENGHVVGLVSSGFTYLGLEYLYIEPMTSIKPWL